MTGLFGAAQLESKARKQCSGVQRVLHAVALEAVDCVELLLKGLSNVPTPFF